MNNILYTKKKNPTYENFEAECPYCFHFNIYNRATDFKTFNPVSFKTVKCQNKDCKKLFNINFDLINSAFEMMILYSYELIERKKYMACILNLTQSLEIFFNTFLCAELIYKLIKRDADFEEDVLNSIMEKFYSSIKDYSYNHLRNIFLNWFTNNLTTASFNESVEIINNFLIYKNTPPLNDLRVVTEPELYQLLIKLYNCKINELRNKIIHSNAYRPNLSETEMYLEEVNSIVFGLRRKLGILSSNINHYV